MRFSLEVYDGAFRVRVSRSKPLIVPIKRRAIGAQNLIIASHIEVDMRMIERGPCAHALQFFDADGDFFSTCVIGEVRNNAGGHIGIPGVKAARCRLMTEAARL